MDRIVWVSRLVQSVVLIALGLQWLVFALLALKVALPVGVILNGVGDSWLEYGAALESRSVSSLWTLGLAEVVMQTLVLLALLGLFRCYGRGEVFSHSACRRLQWLGLSLLGFALTQILFPTCLNIVLNGLVSFAKPLPIVLAVADDDLLLLLWSLAMLAISWVMREACNIKAEHDLVI